MLTVAIPTIAGRSRYLAAALKTCTTQRDDYEILVSDNSNGDARAVVEAAADQRIRYVQPPRYLPMSAHWDFVLSQVRGDVLCIIGDDDGLMPGCVHRVERIRQDVGDVPIQHAIPNYFWPDFVDPKRRNSIVFHHMTGLGGEFRSCAEYLNAVARANARYVDGPMIYHNFVPMRLLSTQGSAAYFRRASPDMWSALAIAGRCDKYFSTREALTLSGQGAKANGAAVHRGDAPEFMAEMNALYAPRYQSRTVQMQLLDCVAELSEQMHMPGLLANAPLASHIAQAVLEARGMPAPTRSSELRELWKIARGRRSAVAMTLIHRAIASRLLPRRPLPEGCIFPANSTVELDPIKVNDIYDATLALRALLAGAANDGQTEGASSP